MIITNNIKDKVYKDDCLITGAYSHYHDIHNDIVIYLPSVLKHSITDNATIEHILIQHIAHETLHKVLDEHINRATCNTLDNICSRKQIRIEGICTLKTWFGGLYKGGE